MKPYRYHINFGPYGAELIAGSLDQNQIDYWSKRSNDDLLDALIHPDTHQTDVPAAKRGLVIPCWPNWPSALRVARGKAWFGSGRPENRNIRDNTTKAASGRTNLLNVMIRE